GETTADTERTVAVTGAVITDRTISHVGVGREMMRCRKCEHPGVKSLWEFHQAADPARIATTHDGCGAAIRVAPVGIFYKSDSLDDLVEGAREASISTHGGSLAIAAAAATAAAVSAALDGASSHQILSLAERAAAEAESRWSDSSAPAFADAIRAVHDHIASVPALQAADVAARCFPNRPL